MAYLPRHSFSNKAVCNSSNNEATEQGVITHFNNFDISTKTNGKMAKNAAATQKFINTYIHMAYSTHIHFNARSIFCACANHSFTFDTHNMRLTAIQMHVCVYVCARLCKIKRRALKIN